MAAYFLDTSTVVKRYVLEMGTPWVQALTDRAAGHFLFVARITDVEMTAALARRRRLGSLSLAEAGRALAAFRQDLAQQYRIVEIAIPLLQQASQLADRHVLRAYDAVQLAATLEIHSADPSLMLISADGELNAAATAEGVRSMIRTPIPDPPPLCTFWPLYEELLPRETANPVHPGGSR